MEFTTRFGLHSQTTRLREVRAPAGRGPSPASHRPRAKPPSEGLRPPARAEVERTSVRHISRARRGRGFGAGLLPLRSPLLRESLLVSFPPLSNMLKFSGSSRPIRGRNQRDEGAGAAAGAWRESVVAGRPPPPPTEEDGPRPSRAGSRRTDHRQPHGRGGTPLAGRETDRARTDGLTLGGRGRLGALDAPAAGAATHRPARRRAVGGGAGPIDGKATLGRAWPREEPGAAMCVRSVDDQCVLQFTLVLAASCVLHRRTSRVIHR